MLQCVASFGCALQCAVVCGSVLQCDALRCSLLQCVAVSYAQSSSLILLTLKSTSFFSRLKMRAF